MSTYVRTRMLLRRVICGREGRADGGLRDGGLRPHGVCDGKRCAQVLVGESGGTPRVLEGYTRGTRGVLEGYSSKRCAQVLVGLFEFDRQAANVTLFEEGDSGHKLYLVRPAPPGLFCAVCLHGLHVCMRSAAELCSAECAVLAWLRSRACRLVLCHSLCVRMSDGF